MHFPQIDLFFAIVKLIQNSAWIAEVVEGFLVYAATTFILVALWSDNKWAQHDFWVSPRKRWRGKAKLYSNFVSAWRRYCESICHPTPSQCPFHCGSRLPLSMFSSMLSSFPTSNNWIELANSCQFLVLANGSRQRTLSFPFSQHILSTRWNWL